MPFSKMNVFFVCIAAIAIVAAFTYGVSSCVKRQSDNQRQIQTACIDNRGTWVSGHCVYPVGPEAK